MNRLQHPLCFRDFYRESEPSQAELWLERYRDVMTTLQPGDATYLGRYAISNGMKPLGPDCLIQNIRWRVLEKRGEKLLLISEYVLDWELFAFDGEKWKESYLRDLLNGEYLQQWFTPEEQLLLCGEPDKVYLLSADKVKRYFPEPDSATAYLLISNDYFPDNDDLAYHVEKNRTEWWLCTPGTDAGCTTYVNRFGKVDEAGFDSDADEFGVRPVIWIDLSRIDNILKGEA